MNNVATVPQPVLQPVTEKQAQAWVALAKAKNDVTYSLQMRELSAQGILLPVTNSEDYSEIDTALAAYRKAHTEMTVERKNFTGMIDANVIQPLMEYEKRVDPKNNATYAALSDRSLSIRKAEKEKADLINATNQEKSQFKIHVENEFLRVAGMYNGSLTKVINQAYTEWLKAGLKKPDIPKLKEVLFQVKVPPVNKFMPHYLKTDDMVTIFDGCQKPDYELILKNMDTIIENVFANWDSDLANAEAAIKAQAEATAIAELEAKKKAEEEAAMNTLITTAETVEIDTPRIKTKVTVVVVESEAWAKSVIAAFITNLPFMTKYMRVKSWSKLNIGQMATYLGQHATDSGEIYKGLELKKEEK